MKPVILILLLCFLSVALSQSLRPGNSPEEGVPIYEEIKVESVLTVRSKSGPRTGKSSSDVAQQTETGSEATVNAERKTRDTSSGRENGAPVDESEGKASFGLPGVFRKLSRKSQ